MGACCLYFACLIFYAKVTKKIIVKKSTTCTLNSTLNLQHFLISICLMITHYIQYPHASTMYMFKWSSLYYFFCPHCDGHSIFIALRVIFLLSFFFHPYSSDSPRRMLPQYSYVLYIVLVLVREWTTPSLPKINSFSFSYFPPSFAPRGVGSESIKVRQVLTFNSLGGWRP